MPALIEKRTTRTVGNSRRGFRLIGLFLVSVALSSACADEKADPAALVARLGSERFDDRVAAYKALEGLGGDALPALRAAAADDAADSRVRTRARALLDWMGRRTETDRVSRPTMVRLDFRNRPLGEVVETLNGRHGFGFVLQLAPTSRHRGFGMMMDDRGPDRLAELRARRITLEAAKPLPFWGAVDRLCEVAALRYDVSPEGGYGVDQGAFLLLADRTGRGGVSDSGPFRVQLAGSHLTYERDFTAVPGTARPGDGDGDGDLTVTLAVLAEPGLKVYPAGRLTVEEAVGDQGRPLAQRPAAAPDPGRSGVRVYGPGTNGFGPLRVAADLVAPVPPPTLLRRLRGKVPVAVVSRRPEPLVIPLRAAGVLGKPFGTRDVNLIVEDIAGASVTVTIRARRADPRPDADPPDFAAFRMDRVLERLELGDASGKRLDFTTGGQMRGADGEGFYDRYTLAPRPAPGDKPGGATPAPVPAELRYYDLVQTAKEIPFDLRDVPTP